VGKRFLALMVLVLITAGLGCATVSAPDGPNGDQVRKIETSAVYDLNLPFPDGELYQAWAIGDRFLLLEQAQGLDNAFFLYDRSEKDAKCIIGFTENAGFEGVEEGKIIFTAKGDGDCGDYAFPYRLVYDPESGDAAQRQALFVPVGQGVAFGTAGAWRQELFQVETRHTELVFGFKPQKGQVLAGGHKRPLTTIDYDPAARELVLHFYNVEPSTEVIPGKTVPVSGHRFIAEYRIEAFPGGCEPENPSLLAQDLPYGLNITDTGALKVLPSIKVFLKLDGEPSYSIVSLAYYDNGGYESTLKHILSFK
jgi:hypothetical protein